MKMGGELNKCYWKWYNLSFYLHVPIYITDSQQHISLISLTSNTHSSNASTERHMQLHFVNPQPSTDTRQSFERGELMFVHWIERNVSPQTTDPNQPQSQAVVDVSYAYYGYSHPESWSLIYIFICMWMCLGCYVLYSATKLQPHIICGTRLEKTIQFFRCCCWIYCNWI